MNNKMDCLLKIRGLKKVYGNNTVLHDIDINIKPGEIVGLIGENGAGKSTLLKIISGVEKPTKGTIEMMGERYSCNSLLAANKMGIGMVFQDQSLIGSLTVAQNIFLGREKDFSTAGVINWSAMNVAARKALEYIDIHNLAPTIKVRDLNFATRQMVEIAKVLDIITRGFDNANKQALLLLDEPTTVLSSDEISNLFKQVRRVKESGNAVIFVSHRLDEVLELCDRIYIFKDGENLGDVYSKDANKNVLYERMVSRETAEEYYQTDRQTIPSDDIVMRIDDLGKFGEFKAANFELHKGEVLGICGLEGSGKEALCSILCGDEVPTSGSIYIGNKSIKFSSPSDALSHGVLSVPKDRRNEGLIGILSIKDNIALSGLKHLSILGVLMLRKIKSISKEWVKRMGVKCTGINERIGRLSGGNAQKVIFARVMNSKSAILILNHPTRGVDVGAKEDIYGVIREMTEDGAAIILLGDTLDEYIGLSSRILVMKDGLVVHEVNCGVNNKPKQVDIVKYMM